MKTNQRRFSARYGIRTALSALAVRRFKERITSHVKGNRGHRAIVQFGIGERFFVKGGDSDEGDQDSGLMVISVPGSI
jgi:hypothetical protein